MNRIALASLTALLALAPVTPWAGESPTQALFKTTVCIVGARPDGSKLEGSGVIVAPGNRVLTVAHALRGATQVRVRLYDGRLFPAEVARFAAADIDLAVLELGDVTLPFAKLADAKNVAAGERVRTVGCPLGYDFTMTVGRVRAFREFEGVPLIQTDVAVHPGSSGGPLFDSEGRVLGIIKAKAENTDDVNFALPVSLAEGFLHSLGGERDGFAAFNRAVAERDPRRKVELYREAVEDLPDMAEPRYNLALALENAGDTQEATTQYREVIRRHPGYAPASLNLGAWLYSEGRYDEAISIYQAALRHRPDSVSVRNNLAEAYRGSGRIPQARSEFLRLTREAPDYAPAQYGIALLYEEDLKDLTSARVHYRRYLELAPESAAAADVRGRLAGAKGGVR